MTETSPNSNPLLVYPLAPLGANIAGSHTVKVTAHCSQLDIRGAYVHDRCWASVCS